VTIIKAFALLSLVDVLAEGFLVAHAPLADFPHVLASLADGGNYAIKTSVDVRR